MIILIFFSSVFASIPTKDMKELCLYKYRYTNTLNRCLNLVKKSHFDKKALPFCTNMHLNRNIYPCLKVIANRTYNEDVKDCAEEFSTPKIFECLHKNGTLEEKSKKKININDVVKLLEQGKKKEAIKAIGETL